MNFLKNDNNNEMKFELKHYRGLMLAQSIDLNNDHDINHSDHIIGSDTSKCETCGEYTSLQNKLKEVRRILNTDFKRMNSTDTIFDNKKKKYYYLCTDKYGVIYVIRDSSKLDAQEKIPTDNSEGIMCNIISQKKAFEEIKLLQSTVATQIIDFLKNDDLFLGIVCRLDNNVKNKNIKTMFG
ncbi:hypothetical protein ABTQ33_06555 [Paucilactobacillus suebicus]|nr:hypothetical protein [Paucilactobacillus suebicus]